MGDDGTRESTAPLPPGVGYCDAVGFTPHRGAGGLTHEYAPHRRQFLARKASHNSRQLMEEPPGVVYIDEPMTTIMDRFESTRADILPVLDKSNKFVGFISKTRLFAAYRQMLVDFSEE